MRHEIRLEEIAMTLKQLEHDESKTLHIEGTDEKFLVRGLK